MIYLSYWENTDRKWGLGSKQDKLVKYLKIHRTQPESSSSHMRWRSLTWLLAFFSLAEVILVMNY